MANPLVTPGLEGARAAMDRDPVAACPFRPGTPEHGEWVREWNMIEAGRREGASVEAKEALGLAPTSTLVGFGDLVTPHPNWSTGPAASVDDVRWFRPVPTGCADAPLIARWADSGSLVDPAELVDWMELARKSLMSVEEWLAEAGASLSAALAGPAVAAAPEPLPSGPKARALAVKQRRGQRPCPVHGPTPGGLCRVCTRR